MKKCAYCGRENEAGALACVECGKEFDEMSSTGVEPQLLDPALSPVVVATFSSLPEASVLVGRLEAAGIEADIPEEYSAQIFSAVIALERLTVRVPAKDLEAAKQIVAEGREDAPNGRQSDRCSLITEPSRDGTTSASQDENGGEPEEGKLCVSCGAIIAQTARQCPKCGWTQPDTI